MRYLLAVLLLVSCCVAQTANGGLTINGGITFNPTGTPAPPVFTNGVPPGGVTTIAYSFTFTATGGTLPYVWTISTGQPTGLTINSSTGVLSGTPSVAGTFNFTVTVTDANSLFTNQNETIQIVSVGPPPLVITSLTPPGGNQNIAYAGFTFTATGGTPAYTWAVASGALPTGLSLNASTGVLSGTPTGSGTYTFAVKVTDSLAVVTTSPSYMVVIVPAPPPTFTNGPPVNGQVGVPYNAPLEDLVSWLCSPYPGRTTTHLAGGLVPHYCWLDADGSKIWLQKSATSWAADVELYDTSFVYDWLTEDGGHFSDPTYWHRAVGPMGRQAWPRFFTFGTPYTHDNIGVFTQGEPTSACVPQPLTTLGNTRYTIDFLPGKTWGAPIGTLDTVVLGRYYAFSGGVYNQQELLYLPRGIGWWQWTHANWNGSAYIVDSNNLETSIPAGGAPSPVWTCGTAFSWWVGGTPGVGGNVALASGIQGFSFTATGGVQPYAWSVSSGALPNGLTLNPTTGLLYGTPTVAATFTFTVKVTGNDGNFSTQAESIIISGAAPPPLLITNTAPPGGTRNQPYTTTFTASGGVPPYAWSVGSGAIPTGLTLDPLTGIMSGTPSASGTFGFTIKVTDSVLTAFTSPTYTVVIAPAIPPVITSAAPGVGMQNVLYSFDFTATCTNLPCTWSSSPSPPIDSTVLTTVAGVGQLRGTPLVAGTYNFTVTVTDALGLFATSPIYSVVISAAASAMPALPQLWADPTTDCIPPGGVYDVTKTIPGDYAATISGLNQAYADWQNVATGDQWWHVVVTAGTKITANSSWTWNAKRLATTTKSIVFDSTLPNPVGQTVCSGGIQDNIPESTDPGTRNPGCTAGTWKSRMWELEGSSTNANGSIIKLGTLDADSVAANHVCVQNANIHPATSVTTPIIPIYLLPTTSITTPTATASHIWFISDYMHGDTTDTVAGNNKISQFVFFANRYSGVVNSYFDGISKIGGEGQVLGGTNSPGPLKWDHNWIEGGEEAVLLGGSPPTITNNIPSDIEFRRNRVTLSLTWCPAPAGTGVDPQVKNRLELKVGQRFLNNGSILENQCAAAQPGHIHLLNVRACSGTTGCNGGENLNVVDITDTNLIIRHGNQGIQTDGRSDGTSSGNGVSMPAQRWLLQNILMYDIGDHTRFNGSGAVQMIAVGATGNTFTANAVRNHAGNSVTLTLTGISSGTLIQSGISTGDLVYVQGCTDTSFNTLTNGIGAVVSSSTPTGLTVIYPNTGTIDATTTCTSVNNGHGFEKYLTMDHISAFATGQFFVGCTGGTKQYVQNWTWTNSFQVSDVAAGGGSIGGFRCSGLQEGTVTENGGADVSTFAYNHDVTSLRQANLYTEYPSGIIGGNPGGTLWFPSLNPCTTSTPDANCLGISGMMGGNPYTFNPANYHSYLLCTGNGTPTAACGAASLFAGGQAQAAADNSSIGVNIPAIDFAQTQNTYSCTGPCGAGPKPDSATVSIPDCVSGTAASYSNLTCNLSEVTLIFPDISTWTFTGISSSAVVINRDFAANPTIPDPYTLLIAGTGGAGITATAGQTIDISIPFTIINGSGIAPWMHQGCITNGAVTNPCSFSGTGSITDTQSVGAVTSSQTCTSTITSQCSPSTSPPSGKNYVGNPASSIMSIHMVGGTGTAFQKSFGIHVGNSGPGGGGGGGSGTVAVYPAAQTVETTVSEPFSALVAGGGSQAVTWAVNNIPGGNGTVGTITGAGIYTAPAGAQTVTISATSTASGLIGTSIVTVAGSLPTINCPAFTAGAHNCTATINGAARTFLFYVPTSYASGTSPMLIALHGDDTTTNTLCALTTPLSENQAWQAYVDLQPSPAPLLVCPQALKYVKTSTFKPPKWGTLDVNFSNFVLADGTTPGVPDDTDFVRQIIWYIFKNKPFDLKRVGVSGLWQSGGTMAQLLAVRNSDQISAISSWLLNPQQRDFTGNPFPNPVNPVSVLTTVGTATADSYLICGDPTIGADGDLAPQASMDQVLSYWCGATGNNCSTFDTPLNFCTSTGGTWTNLQEKHSTNGILGTEVRGYALVHAAGSVSCSPGMTACTIEDFTNPTCPTGAIFSDLCNKFMTSGTTGSNMTDVIWFWLRDHPKP